MVAKWGTMASHWNSRNDTSLVMSLSAGWSENGQCQLSPDVCNTLGINSEQYVTRTNTELAKLGVAGVTLFVSAGDSGANGRTNTDLSNHT
jgi:subtilase family serine protease